MILSTYIICLDNMNQYEEIPDYEKVTMWVTDELSKKRFASVIEMLNTQYANLYGNVGNYDKSNRLAIEGIKIEIECERMHYLNTLLYCIAWNEGERGTASEKDKKLCQWAYEIAKLKKESTRMDLYRKWKEKH